MQASADRLVEDLKRFLAARWWALLLRGLFGIGFGLLALFAPGVAGISLILALALFLLADGVAALVASIGRARSGGRWGWLAVEAVASIVVGVLALAMPMAAATLPFTAPLLGMTLVVRWIGLWAIAIGVLMLLLALRLKAVRDRVAAAINPGG